MKKLLFYLSILILLLVLSLVIAPLFISLDRYRVQIVDAVESVAGVRPNIEGKMDIRFFPSPTLQLTNVSIPNVPNSMKSDIVRIDSIEVDASFAGLLQGKINIRNLRFINPVINLERSSDGIRNWEMFLNRNQKSASDTQNTLPSSIEIKNGYVSYYSATTTRSIDYLNAVVTIGSPDGPFSIKGQFDNASNIIYIEGQTGKMSKSSDASFHIKSKTFSIDFLGKTTANNDLGWSISGNMKSNVPDIGQFSNSFFIDNLLLSNVRSSEALTLESNFLLNNKTLNLSDITLSSDSIKGKGSIDILLNKAENSSISWDISLLLDQVNVDQLLISGKKDDNAQESEVIDYYASSLRHRGLDNYEIDIPQGLALVLDFKINNLIYHKETVSDLKLDLDVLNRKALVHELSASMPGNTSAVFNGIVTHNGIRSLLKGSLKVTGSKLRNTLIWLDAGMHYIPENKLNEFLVTTQIAMTPQKIEFSDVYLSVDRILLTGKANVLTETKLPILQAELSLDGFNADEYNATEKIDTWVRHLSDGVTLKSLSNSWLRTLNLSAAILIDATNIEYNHQKISSISSTLALSPGIFNLQRFILRGEKSAFISRLKFNILGDRPVAELEMRCSSLDTSTFILPSSKKEDLQQPFAWSNAPWSFVNLGIFDGYFSIKSDIFKHANLELANLDFRADLNKRVLTIKDAKATYGKGQAVFDLSLSVDKNSTVASSFKLTNIDMKSLSQSLGIPFNLVGTVNLAGIVKSTGTSPYDWVKKATGNLSFVAANILINDFDLHSIIINATKLYSVIDMQSIIEKATTSGTTLFPKAQGKISIHSGLAELKDVRFSSAYSNDVMAGRISLFNFMSNHVLRFVFSPRRGERVTLNISLKGPFNNLTRTLDTTDLDKYITNKANGR